MAKALLMEAWKDRWSPEKFSTRLRRLSPADIKMFPELIVRQATVGAVANPLLLSYLQHIAGSQVVTFAEVVNAVVQMEDSLKPAILLSIVELLKTVVNSQRVPYNDNVGEDSLQYASAVARLVFWLQRISGTASTRVLELASLSPTNPSASAAAAALNAWTIAAAEAAQLGEVLLRHREHAMLVIIHARLVDTDCSGGNEGGSGSGELPSLCHHIRDACVKLETSAGQLPASIAGAELLASRLRAFVGACRRLDQISADASSSGHEHLLLADAGLVVGILVHIEAQLNASAVVHKFAARLQLAGSLQRLSPATLCREVLRACLIGLAESTEKEKKAWVVFTLLKLPSALEYLLGASGGDRAGSGSVDRAPLESALWQLQTYEALLSSVEDALSGADVWRELLTTLSRRNLLSEQSMNELIARRNQQQRPSTSQPRSESPLGEMVLRVKDNVDIVIKHLTAMNEVDLSSKAPQVRQFMIQHMSGQNLDMYIMAACCSGQLASFVHALLRVNDMCLQVASPGHMSLATDDARLHLFDLTFLMLCRVALSPYATELFGDRGSLADIQGGLGLFFVSWVRSALLNMPDDSYNVVDPIKVDALANRLGSSANSRGLTLRDTCTHCAPAVEQLSAAILASTPPSGYETAFKTVANQMRSMSAAIPVIVSGVLGSRAYLMGDSQRAWMIMLLNGFLEPVNGDNILPPVQAKIDLMHATILEIAQKYRLVRFLTLTPTQRQLVQDDLLVASTSSSPDSESQAATFSKVFERVYEKGQLDGLALHTLCQLRRVSSAKWFAMQLANVLLPKSTVPFVEDSAKAVAVLFGLSHIDLEQLTIATCMYSVPFALQRSLRPFALTEPKCQALAQYSAWCLLAILAYGQDPDMCSPDVTSMLIELHQEEKFGLRTALSSMQYDALPGGILIESVVGHLLRVLRSITRDGMLSQKTNFVSNFVRVCCCAGKPYASAVFKKLPVDMASELLEDSGSSFLVQYVESQLEQCAGSRLALHDLADLCCQSLLIAMKSKTNAAPARAEQ